MINKNHDHCRFVGVDVVVVVDIVGDAVDDGDGDDSYWQKRNWSKL